jgi:hypothetical protein
MSSRKRRQTMDKFRREQAVKQRRTDKLQRKQEARSARVNGGPASEASVEADGTEGMPAATEYEQPDGSRDPAPTDVAPAT